MRLHRPLDGRPVHVRLEPAIGVWIPPHQHQLSGQKRQIGTDRLRQVRDGARAVARVPCAKGPPVEPHRSVVRGSQPGDDVEQRALAGAVAAEHRDELPARDDERHAAEDVAATGAPSKLLDLEAQTHGV